MLMTAVSYALPMTDAPTEHRAKIAEARNVLGEVIARARFAGEPTILINRGKEAAVIVSMEQYRLAKAQLQMLQMLRDQHPDVFAELAKDVDLF